MVVPLPFSRTLVLYGAPITVPRKADVGEWRDTLERVMNDLADEADADFENLWKSGQR